MNDYYYILDENGTPQPESDILKWAEWFKQANRYIAKNHTKRGRVFVSTVFISINHNFSISINHNFSINSPPILWETMIFGSKYDGYQQRYTSREAALKGHKVAYRLAQGKKPKQLDKTEIVYE